MLYPVLTSSGGAMPQPGDYVGIVGSFLPIVLLVVVFYFLLIRPQRKRDKAEKEMRNSIAVGDEVSTIGGIIGKVVSIKDDIFVIETSGDRSKIKLYRWAIRGKEQTDNATDSTELSQEAKSAQKADKK